MALTCVRCGTQNPDGNSFCQACGSPLAAAAPTAPAGPPPAAPPPLMGPPPDLPPPTYQSPYYAPSAGGPQAPVHRTPWVLIVSAVVVLVLIMAGGGTAFAILNARNTNQTGSLPSPSPAGTPSPITQTSPAPGGTAPSTSAVSVTLPSGWVASKSGATITLTNPAGDGSVVVTSGVDSPPQTPQQIKDVVDKQLAAQPQLQGIGTCPNTRTTTGSIGGVAGIWWQLCFTATQVGQSFPGEYSLWVGANSDGSIGYGVILFTLAAKMGSFMNEAKPVLASIQWKLK